MLRDEAEKYIQSELSHGEDRSMHHYNCAEVILNASNDYYKLGLDKKALNMIAPFGGGMCSGNACGILTGGVASIGAIFTKDKPSKNLKLKEVTKLWVEQFEKEFKASDCLDIKEINLKEDEACGRLMLDAADILEKIINSNL